MSEPNALTISPVEGLAKEILDRRMAELQKKIQVYPRQYPIMSDIGECERQMVYSVLNWQDRPLHDADLQARFEVGNIWEREIIRELQNLGYDFVLSQQPVEVLGRGGKLLARGRVDGFIRVDREKIPVEIKSMNVNVYDQIETVEDFQKKPWLRKYTRQLQLYMYGNNIEYGLFIITDCLGHWRVLPVYLDYGECEAILQRLERVVAAIDKKEYPERIPYSDSSCGRCPFAHICLPDIKRNEAQILTSDEIIAQLEERERLAPLKSKYDSLDRNLKKSLKGIEKGIAGEFIIQGEMRHRDGYEVQPTDFWQMKIKRIGSRVKTDD